MLIEQSRFFDGLGFKQIEMKYEYGAETCYEAPNGEYYRVDHFSRFYVIEHAENEEEARLGRFEDTDLFDDSLPEEELIDQIREWFHKYAAA